MPALCEKSDEGSRLTIFDIRGKIFKTGLISMPHSAYVGANSRYICYKSGDEFLIQDYESNIITRTAAADIYEAEMNEYFCVIALSDSDIKFYSFADNAWKTIPHSSSVINLAENFVFTFVSDNTNKIITLNLVDLSVINSKELETSHRELQAYINIDLVPSVNCLKCLKDSIPNVIGVKSHVFCTKDPETGITAFYTMVSGEPEILIETKNTCDLSMLNYGFIKLDGIERGFKFYELGTVLLMATEIVGLCMIKK